MSISGTISLDHWNYLWDASEEINTDSDGSYINLIRSDKNGKRSITYHHGPESIPPRAIITFNTESSRLILTGLGHYAEEDEQGYANFLDAVYGGFFPKD